MASGIPAVASAVGVHNEIIQDGLNGFLAKNDNEWFDKTRRLIEDRALRERLGASARQTAENDYSVRLMRLSWKRARNKVTGIL